MSDFVGTYVFCQQCEEAIVISASSLADLQAKLEVLGWAPYGAGVTPLAEENAQRGEFACRRCANELVQQRLERIARETLRALGVECQWWVIRDQNSPNDVLRVMR